MVIDTVLLCFCKDLEENDGDAKPFYMSKDLMVTVKHLSSLFTRGFTTVSSSWFLPPLTPTSSPLTLADGAEGRGRIIVQTAVVPPGGQTGLFWNRYKSFWPLKLPFTSKWIVSTHCSLLVPYYSAIDLRYCLVILNFYPNQYYDDFTFMWPFGTLFNEI